MAFDSRPDSNPATVLAGGEPRSILILDQCPTEEAVLSTPAYAALADRFRAATRALVCGEETARLLRGDPRLNDVIGIPPGLRFRDWINARSLRLVVALRGNRYDLAIDLTDGARMARLASVLGVPATVGIAGAGRAHHLTHPVRLDPPAADPLGRKLALLERLGCPSRRRRPVLVPARGDERYVLDLLRGTGLDARGRFLLISPTPKWEAILPPLALAGVVDAIGAEHPALATFFAGSAGCRDYVERAAALCGRRPSVLYLSPGHFAAFAAISDLVIGGEGLPSILAGAVGAKVVGVFAGASHSAGDGDRPIDAASLLNLVREALADDPREARHAEKRRYYEQDDFRRARGEANLFLHTAP